MKYGIYYAYWEQEWASDYIPYIEKVAKLGFDFLEIACTPINGYTDRQLKDIRQAAKDNGIFLTAGHGPAPSQNLASADPSVVKNAKEFFTTLLKNLEKLDIHTIGGGIYSYWPVDYSKPIDKAGDWARSVENVREIGKIAGDCGVDYCLEVLNRFEGYLINTCEECVKFVDEVDVPAVKVMLDTFHMNIEEDNIGDAFRLAGDMVAHVHVGEANRKLPGTGRNMPWAEIGQALKDINYKGMVVMEPFLLDKGEVGDAIKVWRDLSGGADDAKMDEMMTESVKFLRSLEA